MLSRINLCISLSLLSWYAAAKSSFIRGIHSVYPFSGLSVRECIRRARYGLKWTKMRVKRLLERSKNQTSFYRSLGLRSQILRRYDRCARVDHPFSCDGHFSIVELAISRLHNDSISLLEILSSRSTQSCLPGVTNEPNARGKYQRIQMTKRRIIRQ